MTTETRPHADRHFVIGFIEEWIAHAKDSNHLVPTTDVDVSILEAAVKLLKESPPADGKKP